MKMIIIVSAVTLILLLGWALLNMKPETTSPINTARPSFSLSFLAGGSITGPTFKVEIADNQVTYEEFSPEDNTSPVKSFTKELTETELSDIIKEIENTQIFVETPKQISEPFILDGGRYYVSAQSGEQKKTIECGMAPTLPTANPFSCGTLSRNIAGILNRLLSVDIR